MGTNDRRPLTMLDVVQTVQDASSGDEEVVAVIAHLLRTGRLRVLSWGNRPWGMPTAA